MTPTVGPPRPEAAAASGRQPSADALKAEVRERLGADWPPRIYRERILPLRTRSHAVTAASRGATVEVQHTLLGVELKVGRKRQSCPDFATARYLAFYARAGCTNVAVPYDITKISLLADELESAWQRMLLLADHLSESRGDAFRRRLRAAVVRGVKEEIEQEGAGAPVPKFNQNTRQRQQRAS